MKNLNNPRFTTQLGAFIKEERNKKHITKRFAACESRINVIYYDQIERGKCSVGLATALRIAKALDIPILAFEKFLEVENKNN